MRSLTRAAVVGGAVVAALMVPSVAFAHPLGNATVNRSDVIVVEPEAVAISHTVDLAELPTIQEMPSVDTDGNGSAARNELAEYAQTRCRQDASRSQLTVQSRLTDLDTVSATATLVDGQAGLQTLLIRCDWRAVATIGDRTAVEFAAAPLPAIGWRELVAVGDRATIADSNVPTASPSRGLSVYPADVLSSAPDQTVAAFVASPGGPALSSDEVGAPVSAPTAADTTTRWLSAVADRATSPIGAALALLAAALVGALHALTPGHGKTAVAFAIAGQERSRRAAMLLGATVTAAHTGSVLVLGLLVATTAAVAPASLYPWLGVLSGLLIVGVGIALARRALQGKRGHVHLGGSPHGHAHEHPHDHSPGHSHGHEHTPDASGVAVLTSGDALPHAEPERFTSRRTLVALGIAGGVVPSPSALLVLLGTAAAGQAWWGVALVIAFGAGMALTLAAAGLLAWRVGEGVREWASMSQHTGAVRVSRALPVIAAVGVGGAGLVVLVRSALPLLVG